jgi:putative Ca2+/H+ antiporter (TMEM165/GDT1 family)
MFWKTFITAFVALFIAELGDKTQLALLCLASKKECPHWAVFLGAVVALVLVTFVAVFVGRLIGTNFPRQYVRKAAGAVFVIIGVLMFLGKC